MFAKRVKDLKPKASAFEPTFRPYDPENEVERYRALVARTEMRSDVDRSQRELEDARWAGRR